MLTLTTTAQGDPPAWVMILGGVVVVVMFGVITYRKRMRESGSPLGPLAIFRASPPRVRRGGRVSCGDGALGVCGYDGVAGASDVRGIARGMRCAGAAAGVQHCGVCDEACGGGRRQSFAGGLEHSLTAKPSYARAFGAVCVLIGGVMLYVVPHNPCDGRRWDCRPIRALTAA